FDVTPEEGKDRFQDFALPLPLLRGIHELGYQFCTPIQSAVLPLSLADYDVTGQAQTGTGKTAAFLITILTHCFENPLEHTVDPGCPRALVLAPTRELALQIEGDAKALGRYMEERTLAVVGGMDLQRQKDKLHAKPVDLLVATPGRLIDFINRRDVNLRHVEILVIDEADRMLDMGFVPDVRRIVYQTPPKRK
ncbi:MAG: DEAD/DEAH box helicase, partial [Gammaproteobacteria bacterium]|nr:DEAD/DEAH box helicase [Gammaproteobacteria bacterium]